MFCREVIVDYTISSIKRGDQIQNWINLYLDTPLSASASSYRNLTLEISLNDTLYKEAFSPSRLDLISTSGNGPFKISCNSGLISLGTSLTVNLSGNAYDVIYSKSQLISVYSPYPPPPVPILSNAALNEIGNKILITFTDPTDQGNLKASFEICDILLNINTGYTGLYCSWIDEQTIRIELSKSHEVNINIISIKT